MKSNKFIRASIIIIILAFNIGCDQITKSIARKDLPDNKVIGFLANHVTLEKTDNLGGPVKYVLLMGLPLLALVGALVYIIIKTDITKYTLLGIIMVIGGGVGNLYDRILHGSVTDFMHIDFIIFQTGVFNVADMSIMAGMGIILVDSYLKRKEEKKHLVAEE